MSETYTQIEGVGTRSISKMIEQNFANADELTPWEIEFSADMEDQHRLRLGGTNWLSVNQLNIIERIYKKLHAKGVV